MNQYCEVAVLAAESAAKIIQMYANRITELTVEEKSAQDYVSKVDREAELSIIDVIQKYFPEHAIYSEEFGYSHAKKMNHASQSKEYQWLVDPLDGTTNYLFGIPHYAVSIALVKQDKLEACVVLDPSKKEKFTAACGQGAWLNNKPISVKKRDAFSGSLLATGVPFNGEPLEKISSFTQTLEYLLSQKTSGIRRLGSAALDLAYVAAGRYDGYWEAYLNPWDIAAGALLVKEAGGVVTDLFGGQGYLKSGSIVAATEQSYTTILSATRQYYSES